MQTLILEPIPKFSQYQLDVKASLQMIVDINAKWVAVRDSLENSRKVLIDTIAENFRIKSTKTWRAAFSDFFDQLSYRVSNIYHIVSELNNARNNNAGMIEANATLQQFAPSLLNSFTRLNACFLQVSQPNFQESLHIDLSELLESISGVDDLNSITKIAYFKPNERLSSDSTQKKFTDKDIVNIMKEFKSKMLALVDQKIEILQSHFKTAIEIQLAPLFQQLQLLLNKLIEKAAYMQQFGSNDDPEQLTAIQAGLNEFFWRFYPVLAAEFDKNVKLVFSDEHLAPSVEDAIIQTIEELGANKEDKLNKQNLLQLFCFEQAKVTCNSVLPTCMMVLKATKPPKVIEVKSFNEEKKRSDDRHLPVFQFGYLFFALLKKENLSNLNPNELDEIVLVTNELYEVEKHDIWQVQIDFMPPNYEISRHELLTLYFLAKLADATLHNMPKQKKEELINSKKMSVSLKSDSLVLKVGIDSFFSFFFAFIRFLYQKPKPKEPSPTKLEPVVQKDPVPEIKQPSPEIKQPVVKVEESRPNPKPLPEEQKANPVMDPKLTILPHLATEESVILPDTTKKNFLPGDRMDFVYQTVATEPDINYSVLDDFPSLAQGNLEKKNESPTQLESIVITKKIDSDEKTSPVKPMEESQVKRIGLDAGAFNVVRLDNIHMFDNLQIVDFNEVDQNWESIDIDFFRDLLEKGGYRFFNDLNSFKEIVGATDYIFVDKKDTLDLVREFNAHMGAHPGLYTKGNKSRQESFNNPNTQRALQYYDRELTRGIVLLFVPGTTKVGLVTIKIDFAHKTNTYFLTETNVDSTAVRDMLKKFLKYIKHTLKIHHQIKFKFSKFKEVFVYFRMSSEPYLLNSFRNFYFPYLKLVRGDYLSQVETVTLQTLRDSLMGYLFALYDSKLGIEQFKNLLLMYQVFHPRFQSILVIDEFNDSDSFFKKTYQYLNTCLVDHIETHSLKKLKSTMMLARIFNEKTQNTDTVLLYFEYGYSVALDPYGNSYDSANLEESFETTSSNAQKKKMKCLQNIYVFGDNYSQILQLRQVFKSFFTNHQDALERVQFCFCQMTKAKSTTNLFFQDRAILYCIVSILLNEGLQIQDALGICRLSPSIQYNYFCTALEKVRSSSKKPENSKPRSLLQSIAPSKRAKAPKNVDLIEESQLVIENLGLGTEDGLRMQIDIMNSILTIKRIVGYTLPPQKDSNRAAGSFTVDTRYLIKPNEPYAMVIINKFANKTNPNICNIIEPDGSVYIVTIATDESQTNAEKNLAAIQRSVEDYRKLIPRLKNFNPRLYTHLILFKNCPWENLYSFIDFIVILYLQKYKPSKDYRFSVTDNAILNIVLGDPKLCLKNFQGTYELLLQLKKSHSMLFEPGIVVAHVGRNYQEEYLNSLLAVFFTTIKLNKFIFCIQNDMEYTFHVLAKDDKNLGALTGITISLKDQSHGVNAKNYYQDFFALLQRDLCNIDINHEVFKIETEPVAEFFYKIDPDLITLGLVDAINSSPIAKLGEVLKEYLECWYRPSMLTGQMIGLSDRLKAN